MADNDCVSNSSSCDKEDTNTGLAVASIFTTWQTRLTAVLRRWRLGRQRRRDLEILLDYDERLLKDIGVTRYDILKATNRSKILSRKGEWLTVTRLRS